MKHENAEVWTCEDDALLLSTICVTGTIWNKVKPHFPNRSIPSIRNRWLRIEKNDRTAVKGKKKKKATTRVVVTRESCDVVLDLGFDLSFLQWNPEKQEVPNQEYYYCVQYDGLDSIVNEESCHWEFAM